MKYYVWSEGFGKKSNIRFQGWNVYSASLLLDVILLMRIIQKTFRVFGYINKYCNIIYHLFDIDQPSTFWCNNYQEIISIIGWKQTNYNLYKKIGINQMGLIPPLGEYLFNSNKLGLFGVIFRTINKLMMKISITQPAPLLQPSPWMRGEQIHMYCLYMPHRNFLVTHKDRYKYQWTLIKLMQKHRSKINKSNIYWCI